MRQFALLVPRVRSVKATVLARFVFRAMGGSLEAFVSRCAILSSSPLDNHKHFAITEANQSSFPLPRVPGPTSAATALRASFRASTSTSTIRNTGLPVS
jgi:hypothetical protein